MRIGADNVHADLAGCVASKDRAVLHKNDARPVAGGGDALERRLNEIFHEVDAVIRQGKRFIVLSDRDSDAQLALEAAPFAALVAEIDDFFGDEISTALSGPEALGAETEARRIIGEHLGRATTRLAVGAAVLPQTDWTTASDLAEGVIVCI
jgi:hypothetical protein